MTALDYGLKAIDAKIKAEKTWWIPKVQASIAFLYGILQHQSFFV
jgi:hypothetical protein